jgi:hypothetical protein
MALKSGSRRSQGANFPKERAKREEREKVGKSWRKSWD